VVVLLPPDRNPGVVRRAVGAATPFRLQELPERNLDMKAVVYAFCATMNELCERFDVRSPPMVVDLGCSTGSFSALLGSDQMYVGFDISFASLAFARRSTGRFYVQADAEVLPIKTGSVPFFVSREVLEHLNDVRAAIRELARIGHRGVIQTPTLDFPFLYDPINYVLTRFGSRAKFGIYGYDHHELFDRDGWRELLTSGGLRVERECPIGTGLALNGSCIALHSLFSWREFDSLPRNGVATALARRLFPLYAGMHRLDRVLYPFGFTQAYGVVSDAR
jgi:SAM-dependent methyltransferase